MTFFIRSHYSHRSASKCPRRAAVRCRSSPASMSRVRSASMCPRGWRNRCVWMWVHMIVHSDFYPMFFVAPRFAAKCLVRSAVMSPKKSAAWLMRGSVTHSPRSNATRSALTPTGARNAPITDDGRYLELQRRLQLRNLACSSPIQLSSKPISRMYHTDLPSCPILCILYISITTSRLNSEQCT